MEDVYTCKLDMCTLSSLSCAYTWWRWSGCCDSTAVPPESDQRENAGNADKQCEDTCAESPTTVEIVCSLSSDLELLPEGLLWRRSDRSCCRCGCGCRCSRGRLRRGSTCSRRRCRSSRRQWRRLRCDDRLELRHVLHGDPVDHGRVPGERLAIQLQLGEGGAEARHRHRALTTASAIHIVPLVTCRHDERTLRDGDATR